MHSTAAELQAPTDCYVNMPQARPERPFLGHWLYWWDLSFKTAATPHVETTVVNCGSFLVYVNVAFE